MKILDFGLAKRVETVGGDERADAVRPHGARHDHGNRGLHVARAGRRDYRSTTDRTSSRSARSSTSCSRGRGRSSGRRMPRRWRQSCGTSRRSCRSRGGTFRRLSTASSSIAWRRTGITGSSRPGTSPSTSWSSPRRAARAAHAKSPRRSAPAGFWVAVLPFKRSGDAETESFADGLGEEITTGLSRFRYLSVVASASAARLKGEAGDERSLGAKLGARYVLEGSIRKGGSVDSRERSARRHRRRERSSGPRPTIATSRRRAFLRCRTTSPPASSQLSPTATACSCIR